MPPSPTGSCASSRRFEAQPRVGLLTYVERAAWGVRDRPAALLPQSYVAAWPAPADCRCCCHRWISAAAGRALDGLDALVLTGGADVDPPLPLIVTRPPSRLGPTGTSGRRHRAGRADRTRPCWPSAGRAGAQRGPGAGRSTSTCPTSWATRRTCRAGRARGGDGPAGAGHAGVRDPGRRGQGAVLATTRRSGGWAAVSRRWAGPTTGPSRPQWCPAPVASSGIRRTATTPGCSGRRSGRRPPAKRLRDGGDGHLLNPATEQVVDVVPHTSAQATDEAIARSPAVSPAWRAVAPADRARLLRRSPRRWTAT